MLTMTLPILTATTMQLDGWTITLDHAVLADRPLWEATRSELTRQLGSIVRVMPPGPLEKLQQVRIWINASSPETVCMAFHPDASWLKDHHMNPEMAGGVEVGSAKTFLSWTYEQPWMVLHELAHAYHFQFLLHGFDNEDVKAAYASAMADKKYDHVLHWDGKYEKAYATTNSIEYFSECSEAYFGQNDFYPFVRAELKEFDRAGYALMVKEWGEAPVKKLP